MNMLRSLYISRNLTIVGYIQYMPYTIATTIAVDISNKHLCMDVVVEHYYT